MSPNSLEGLFFSLMDFIFFRIVSYLQKNREYSTEFPYAHAQFLLFTLVWCFVTSTDI